MHTGLTYILLIIPVRGSTRAHMRAEIDQLLLARARARARPVRQKSVQQARKSGGRPLDGDVREKSARCATNTSGENQFEHNAHPTMTTLSEYLYIYTYVLL